MGKAGYETYVPTQQEIHQWSDRKKKENKITFYKGKIVVPDAHYVDMNKARALREVKAIVEQIKKDWYENK